jgi:hypothetical protein
MLTKKLLTAAAMVAFAAGSAGGVGIAQAKHGSDDPPSHDVRDDHGAARHHAHAAHHRRHAESRHHHRHGGDDRPGDDRGGDR